MAKLKGQEPLPESGERVIMPPKGSIFNKPPKPMTGDETNTARRASAKRKRWEATPEGQARTTSMGDTPVETMEGVVHWPRAQRYFAMHYDDAPVTGPRHYDRQLPGMADPDAAPRPPRWEELPESARQHAERSLKMYGTSIHQMTADIGAQIDQAHERAWRNGETVPYASRFYEKGSEPRERVDESARDLGISPLIHAQMNAFTSPNTKFSIRRKDGSTTFPNDDAAVHAVRWAQSGRDPQGITNDLTTTRSGTGRAQGYVTNMRKAASAMEQHDRGIAPADWRFGDGTKDAFSGSPKTGPYANSWGDTHPQFTVADVHTGGGGAFPHLGSDKPIIYNADGTPQMTKGTDGSKPKEKRGKSEREIALERTPFAHSAIDYAMRQAMDERNLSSVRRTQATQWGEEQLQRGEAGLRGAPREAVVYPPKQARKELPGQGSLFD